MGSPVPNGVRKGSVDQESLELGLGVWGEIIQDTGQREFQAEGGGKAQGAVSQSGECLEA